MRPTDLDRLAQLLLPRRWIFAKTMPQNPHWYTLRKEWEPDAQFVDVVEQIRRHGYPEIYNRRPYTMLNLNGMKYWTMGAPIPATILINRRWIEGVHQYGVDEPYDAIAPVYDQAFSDPTSRAENEQVIALLGDVSRADVLDVGCGTGLLLDYLQPGAYLGIDPSLAMLARLKEKHPNAATLACRLEEYSAVGSHDLVVSLFGAVNYMHPDFVRAIPRLLAPGGRYVVMFYTPGYSPVTYTRTGITAHHWDGVHADLPGTREPLGNFIVVRGSV